MTPAGASSDTPLLSSVAGASSDTLPTTNTITGASSDTSNGTKPRRHRISGAEQKRRKKARQAELAKANSGGKPEPAASTQRRHANPSGSGQQSKTVAQAGGSNRVKRTRSDGSDPSPNVRKKTCPLHPPKPPVPRKPAGNYLEASKRHLKVAVICRSNPSGKIPSPKAQTLQDQLSRQLDHCLFALKEGEEPPVFDGWHYSGEFLRITCGDNHSLEWLKSTVNALPSLWDNAQLEVVTLDKLPRLVKTAVWIPGKADERETVIRRLAAQNPHLKVSNWCVFHDAVKVEPLGRLLIFGISDDDAKTVVEKGKKLRYGFSQLSVKLKFGVPTPPQLPASAETAAPSSQGATSMELVSNEAAELKEFESLLISELSLTPLQNDPTTST